MIDKKIIAGEPKYIKKLRGLKKYLNILICVIVIPILFVNIVILIKFMGNKEAVPDFMGYKLFVIMSGSMEPKLQVGDIIIVKNVKIDELKKDDIISYKSDNSVITHRIMQVKNEVNSISLITKGDNNNTNDEEKITEKMLEGKYVFKIPLIGKIIVFFQTQLGLILLITIPILSYFIIYKINESIVLNKINRKAKRLEYEKKMKEEDK